MEPRQIAEIIIDDFAAAVSTGRRNLIEGARFRVKQLLDTWYPQQPTQPPEPNTTEKQEKEEV